MRIPPRKLEVPGNERAYCWRESLATVMEIDPREVPKFLELDWFDRYKEWAYERGWQIEDWCICERCRPIVPVPDTGILHVDCGESYHHAIVIQNGKLFYDPANAGMYYFHRPWKRFSRLTRI
jgi:hypothetical protein